MSYCRGSPRKRRHSRKKGSNPSDYARGMRGHEWERIMKQTGENTYIKEGIRCKRCGKTKLVSTI